MSCNRCINVHNAQTTGLQTKKCECDCHIINITGATFTGTQNWTDYSSGAADISCSTTVYTDGSCTDLNLSD